MKNLCHLKFALSQGRAPEGRYSQGLPSFNREVRARVIQDAIVSTKTFRNATIARKSFQTQSGNFLSKLYGTGKTFEKDYGLSVSY